MYKSTSQDSPVTVRKGTLAPQRGCRAGDPAPVPALATGPLKLDQVASESKSGDRVPFLTARLLTCLDFTEVGIRQVQKSENKELRTRNIDRFPDDFMFVIDKREFAAWRSQFVISNADRKGHRYWSLQYPLRKLGDNSSPTYVKVNESFVLNAPSGSWGIFQIQPQRVLIAST
jgi:hypothetical protein